jgi:hypothetical protein
MSAQILQLESSFTASPTHTNLIPENWVHPSENSSSAVAAAAASSVKIAQQLAEIQATLPVPVQALPSPPPQLEDIPPQAESTPNPSSISSTSLEEENMKTSESQVPEAPIPPSPSNSNKRKFDSMEPGPATDPEVKPPSQKSIKITLKRQEGGDSYSLLNISESGNQAPGTMRSLKIKGKITSGEQAGNTTDVVVRPVVHTIPIPDPDADGCESNRTIVEEEDGSVSGLEASVVLPLPSNKNTMRLVIF